MKPILVGLILILYGFARPAYAETPLPVEGESFSAQGVITEVNPEEKNIRVQIEEGLELIFYVEDATTIKAGETGLTLTDLEEGSGATLNYSYNENYEKVAHTILITPAEKTEPPPT